MEGARQAGHGRGRDKAWPVSRVGIGLHGAGLVVVDRVCVCVWCGGEGGVANWPSRSARCMGAGNRLGGHTPVVGVLQLQLPLRGRL